MVVICVVLLAVIYFGLTAKLFNTGIETMGARGVTMNRSDVRYGFGNATLVQEQPKGPWRALTDPTTMNNYRGWAYRDPSGATFEMAFDDAQRVTDLSCWNGQLQPEACPDVLGVRLGDTEDLVAYRLGAPDRQTYRGQQKIMTYGDIGLKLTLRQFMVERIELSAEKRGGIGMFGTYLRWIVP